MPETKKMIGVLVPTLESVSTTRLIMTMHRVLKEKGYKDIVMFTDHGIDEKDCVEEMLKIGVQGLVVLPGNTKAAHVKMVNELDIPIVFVGQKVDEGNYIIYDDYMAGCTIGEYMASSFDFSNYLFIGVSEEHESVGVRRKQGVYTALQDRGVEKISFLETDFTYETAAEKIHNYLQNHKPDAIICATDRIAMACYKELTAMGWKIPEEVSLAGFGGYTLTQLMSPSLTTVRYPNEMAGILAGEMIAELIEGKTDIENHKILDYQLLEGGSVKHK